MQINLFKCTAERNRVDKSNHISNRFAINGPIKKPTSVTNIIIEVKKTNPTLYDYNYMYIDEFKRWYFIDDIRLINATMWEIIASVDVLFSFMSDIKSSRGVVDKYEKQEIANVYFDDGSFIMDTRKDVEVKMFPNGLNETGSYILICAGGV